MKSSNNNRILKQFFALVLLFAAIELAKLFFTGFFSAFN